MLNTKSILKEEILSFLSESKQYQKSRKFLLENSDSFSDHVFNEQFKKLFLEALDYDSFYKNDPDIEENLRQVATEFSNILEKSNPEIHDKYYRVIQRSIYDPLVTNEEKEKNGGMPYRIWDYRHFEDIKGELGEVLHLSFDSPKEFEAFGKALHMAAKKINPDSFGPSKEQTPQTQQASPQAQQNSQQNFPSGRLVQHIVEWINERFPGEEFGDYLVKETQRLFPSKPLVQKFFETFADQLKEWKNDEGERFNLEGWVVSVSEEIQNFGEDFDFYQYFPEFSNNSSTNQQQQPSSQQPSVASQQNPLTDEEKIINQFLKKIDMKGFIEKWLEKSKESLSPEGKNAILEYCRDDLFPDRLLSESQLIKLSRERLAQIIKEEMK